MWSFVAARTAPEARAGASSASATRPTPSDARCAGKGRTRRRGHRGIFLFAPHGFPRPSRILRPCGAGPQERSTCARKLAGGAQPGRRRPYAWPVATETSGVLLNTKLNPPVVGELVERPRLVESLVASTHRLKLIRAPAGWGKSTLVAAWSAAAEQLSFAWLALDAADNDADRFWTYVIESLRSLDPTVGESSVRLLSAPGTGIAEHVVPTLLTEITALRAPAVLAIDDLQTISNPEIHSQLSLFIEHLPATLQVSLTSRTEPPLPLARWRARGELLEVDAAELRFAPDEAEHLLNGILDLDLEPGQVASLCERTEGWAAGLFLAALSLRGARDRAMFVERFAGDDRNVVDYLGGEVLDAQPPHVREALMRTSILDRFC